MMKSGEIRQHFLDFFKSKGHTIVPSAPIVIKNDPTLLFTNAGMNQFKEYFLGNKPAPYSRAVDTQKCLRVSGKHNDLEEVGVDTYHHTMFEMLGNWSFGNAETQPAPYFKEEAIAWSWELLTRVYGIPETDLYVSVFKGDPTDGLPKDEASWDIWKKWVREDRIILGAKKDNFWEMGETGPCGPCTEIHVDCRSDEEKNQVAGRDLINRDHPQVIEIWNNVFIQYNRKKDGSLELLPARHVDTGMGFERLVRVLQKKQSNYDTDIFTPAIRETEIISGKKYMGTDSQQDIAFRVIADHIRAIAFPVADGQLPSNTGAGYVIRRILRRAVRYYFSYLEVKEPMLYKLLPVIAEQFEQVFPELHLQRDFVSKVIFEEENNFLRTLDHGLKKIESLLRDQTTLSGKSAFELYDTYGFPLDLTCLIASEKKISVDEAGFELEMQQQKDRSRAAAQVDTDDWVIMQEQAASEFVGYTEHETLSAITRYRKTTAQGNTQYQLVLNKTPFYAESGGQVGDTGTLDFNGERIDIINTKKENDLIIHFSKKLPASVELMATARIDEIKRKNTAAHHSATHLLHAALRHVLGTHVTQKGSLVNENYLRFDFSHFSKVSDTELQQIEALVNEKIRQNIPVSIREMDKDEALELGAMALFGEKYGERVRVVVMEPSFSIELCGGTHVQNTGELGYFKIIHETAVGSGVRRIEAVAGVPADKLVQDEFKNTSVLREMLKNPRDINKAVANLLTENTQLKKQVEKLEADQINTVAKGLLADASEINGIRFVGAVVNVPHTEALKKLCLSLKDMPGQFVIVLAAIINGKPQVALALDEKTAQVKQWQAPTLIREYIAPLIKGGGGGQPLFATAGGSNAEQITSVPLAIRQLL